MFNIDEYPAEVSTYGSLLPEGCYHVICTRASLETAVNGESKWWNLTHQLMVPPDHQFAKRYLWASCTWEHQREPDWAIRGRSNLANCCFAAGLPKQFDPQDLSNLLENKQYVVRVYHRKMKDGSLKDQIGGYFTLSGQSRTGEVCPPQTTWITSDPAFRQKPVAAPQPGITHHPMATTPGGLAYTGQPQGQFAHRTVQGPGYYRTERIAAPHNPQKPFEEDVPF